MADFPSGWDRHEQDSEIVLTSHLEIFRAAANDASCRAAILRVAEEQKANDNETYMRLWYQNANAVYHPIGGAIYKSRKDTLIADGNLMLAESLIKSQSKLACEMARCNAATTVVLGNFRQDRDKKPHGAHKFKVLVRVFGSAGTILPFKDAEGFFQVDHGDYLFMKEECPHSPDFLTDENSAERRITVSTVLNH